MLSAGDAALLEQYMTQLRPSVVEGELLDLPALFGGDAPVHLEIGFGAGEHLAGLAARHPDEHFLGCEPFIDGVGRLLRLVDADALTNIRIWDDDARLLLDVLPDACLSSAYILFPDPWPKTRHHKRRIVNHALLDALSRVLMPGGKLMLATDHRGYASWMLQHLLMREDFVWMAERATDFLSAPAGWVETRYQQKTTAQGRWPLFLVSVKK